MTNYTHTQFFLPIYELFLNLKNKTKNKLYSIHYFVTNWVSEKLFLKTKFEKFSRKNSETETEVIITLDIIVGSILVNSSFFSHKSRFHLTAHSYSSNFLPRVYI